MCYANTNNAIIQSTVDAARLNNEEDAAVAAVAASATGFGQLGSAASQVHHPRPSTGGMMIQLADTVTKRGYGIHLPPVPSLVPLPNPTCSYVECKTCRVAESEHCLVKSLSQLDPANGHGHKRRLSGKGGTLG